MPPARVTRRRKSSLAIGLSPVKPGNYGINTPSPRNVTFAPNVTPGTYVESDSASTDDSEPPSPADALFPPSETPAPAPSRRRVPPGKRRSQGYIPRPPNAFMLFRADFVRQKHVPGSIETNHGSLSKIIGNCWRALPLEEKRVWESRAKKAKAEHRERYPNYRFRPVHNKHKKQAAVEAAKRKEKLPVPALDERRCEEVAQLLLEGKKGDELAAAVRRLDIDRVREMTGSASPMLHMPAPLPAVAYHQPLYGRRSSSVPPTLFNPMMIPSLPFLAPSQHSLSRPESPVSNIARSQRMLLGQRRASSANAALFRSYTMPTTFLPGDLQRDDEPLPDVDTSLFEPTFFDSHSAFGFAPPQHPLSVQTYPETQPQHPELALSISPLDSVNSMDQLSSASTAQPSAYSYYTPDVQDGHLGAMQWLPSLDCSSGPSSAFSGSPARSEVSLPHHMQNVAADQSVGVHAPQPQQPVTFDGWHDPNVAQPQIAMGQAHLGEFTDMDFMDNGMHLQEYANGLEHAAIYGSMPEQHSHCGVPVDAYAYHDAMGMQAEVQQY